MIRGRSECPAASERLLGVLPSPSAKEASNRRSAEAKLPDDILCCYFRATAWGHLLLLFYESAWRPAATIVRLRDRGSGCMRPLHMQMGLDSRKTYEYAVRGLRESASALSFLSTASPRKERESFLRRWSDDHRFHRSMEPRSFVRRRPSKLPRIGKCLPQHLRHAGCQWQPFLHLLVVERLKGIDIYSIGTVNTHQWFIIYFVE